MVTDRDRMTKTEDGYECAYPGCGYTHTDRGAVRLHYIRKHEDAGPKQGECDHEWRLTRDSDGGGRGALAIEQGYVFFCPKCGQVAKKGEVA